MELDLIAEQSAAPKNGTVTAMATASVLLILAGVLTVAFRSSDNSSPVSSARLASLIHSASAALQREPASSFRMTETISVQGQHRTIVMTGVTDNRDHASTFTMTTGGLNQGAVAVNGIAYIQVLPGDAARNDGKAWLAVRSPKPTAQQQQLQEAGPAGLLQALNRIGGTIENEGAQDVEGVQTTEYSFHADFLKLFGSLFSKIFGSDVTSRLKALGFDRLPMQLWLDGQGLPRKMELDISFRGVSISEVTYMTPTNVIPTISAPPASEVRMVGSLGQFGSVLRHLSGLS